MGDAGDGSSNAAQRAQETNENDPPLAETGQREETSRGFFERLFGPRTEEEAAGAAEPARTNGVTPPGLRNLRSMRVEDVMLPKVEIVAVPVDIKKDGLYEVFRESGMTRLPVYQGTLDTPLGLVHLKDFALMHGFNGGGERYNLRKMLRPLIYAPPSMPIGVLLQKMQQDRRHMALVIDEYGGVDGLVTIEDLIEQVVGEIEDEHDIAEGRYWTKEADGCYLVQARAPVEEFEAEIGRRLVDDEDLEELDTLGGLVFMLAGRVPARGEVIHHEDGTDFEVVEADPRRIKRLRVRIAGTGPEGPGEAKGD